MGVSGRRHRVPIPLLMIKEILFLVKVSRLYRLSPDGKKHPFLKGATGIGGMVGLMANSMPAEHALRSWLKLIRIVK